MLKPRLTRLSVVFHEQPIYFVTVCTTERQPLVATEPTHRAFLSFCEEGANHGAYVGQYVLMPDHIHLFVSFARDSIALSVWIKSLKNYLSKQWRSAGIPSPHWQKGFFDHVLRSADSYAEKWGYVLANPVRAGIAATTDAWPYHGTIHALQFSGRRS